MPKPPVQPQVSAAAIEAAQASFARCNAEPEFYESFYRNFFRKCPRAEPMFENTDFRRQHRLLRHAIGMLLIFPNQTEADLGLLIRVAERHSRRDLDVDASFYPLFVDALVDTVRTYDPYFTRDIGHAWRAVLAPGVEYMISRY
jgi:hemoglobin-like flavoprotein